MYIELSDITRLRNRLGEYKNDSTAYQDMIKYCMNFWKCKESDLFTTKDFSESYGNQVVYRVRCNTNGKRSKKFALEIKS